MSDESGRKAKQSPELSQMPGPIRSSRPQSFWARIFSLSSTRDAVLGAREAAAQRGFVEEQTELGVALEKYQEQVVRTNNIEAIKRRVEDNIYGEQVEANRSLKRQIHLAEIDGKVFEREELEEDIRLETARRKLEEIRNPPIMEDITKKIEALTDDIDELTLKLGEHDLTSDEYDALKRERRNLANELDFLKQKIGRE